MFKQFTLAVTLSVVLSSPVFAHGDGDGHCKDTELGNIMTTMRDDLKAYVGAFKRDDQALMQTQAVKLVNISSKAKQQIPLKLQQDMADMPGMKGMDHSNMKDMSDMKGMDHSKMKDMSDMQGIDHSNMKDMSDMQGMDHSNMKDMPDMQGMDHSNMKDMPDMQGMQGMDHSNMKDMSDMQGMDHSKMADMSDMQGMDHSKMKDMPDMQGMDHSKMENMPGMDHATHMQHMSYLQGIDELTQLFKQLQSATAKSDVKAVLGNIKLHIEKSHEAFRLNCD